MAPAGEITSWQIRAGHHFENKRIKGNRGHEKAFFGIIMRLNLGTFGKGQVNELIKR